jgi:hypothetical protein
MVKTDLLNNGKFILHYSDEGKMLRQVETGELYGEAVDIVPCKFTYEETDISVDGGEECFI